MVQCSEVVIGNKARGLVIADDDGGGFTEGEEGCFRVDAVENKSGVVNRLRPLLMRMILIPLSFARNSLQLGYFTIILRGQICYPQKPGMAAEPRWRRG